MKENKSEKCSCGKKAIKQTGRGNWYCRKCWNEGAEIENEAMGYEGVGYI